MRPSFQASIFSIKKSWFIWKSLSWQVERKVAKLALAWSFYELKNIDFFLRAVQRQPNYSIGIYCWFTTTFFFVVSTDGTTGWKQMAIYLMILVAKHVHFRNISHQLHWLMLRLGSLWLDILTPLWSEEVKFFLLLRVVHTMGTLHGKMCEFDSTPQKGILLILLHFNTFYEWTQGQKTFFLLFKTCFYACMKTFMPADRKQDRIWRWCFSWPVQIWSFKIFSSLEKLEKKCSSVTFLQGLLNITIIIFRGKINTLT